MEYLQYTVFSDDVLSSHSGVLNLVINGIPSILKRIFNHNGNRFESFKPCYKWNTFNTNKQVCQQKKYFVCFKPCYKWNTFNTNLGIPLEIRMTEF